MNKKKMDTRYMVTLALLCGIVLMMGTTGIGFIPLPVIKATTMHIPVILGAVLLGPGAGAVLGAVFGICSIWSNTVSPGLLSFAFSPFLSNEGLLGVIKSIWIGFGCRVTFGYLTGWIWKLIKNLVKRDFLALPIAASIATILHTFLVMGSIYILLAQQYAAAKNVAVTAVFGLIMGTITASGIPEAIVAAILVTVIGKALLHFMDQLKLK